MFQSLGHANYRLYALGTLVTNVGIWMQGTAQAWLVLQLTDSAAFVGLSIGVQLVPLLVLSPLGGVLADRYRKRTILRIAQVGLAAPALALGLLAITELVSLWQVLMLSALFGVSRALEGPARQSFVSELVPRDSLVNAVGLNSASVNSARLIGPGVAGLMIGALGSGVVATGTVIAMNSLAYAASFTTLTIIKADTLLSSSSSEQHGAGMRPALAYLRTRPDLIFVLACVFFLGGFGLNFDTVNTLMVVDQFGLGASEFGLAASVLAMGSVVGALTAAARQRPTTTVIGAAALTFALLQIGSGLAPKYAMYLILLPLLGLTVVAVVSSANALIQSTCSSLYRGRVAAIYQMVFIGSVPFAAPLIGWVGEYFGPRAATTSAGIVAALGVTASVIWYARRRGKVRPKIHSPALPHA